jgi:hypothetical protein
MPRRKGSAQKWTTGRVFMVGIGLMFVALFIFGGPLQYLYDTYGPEWIRTPPADIAEDAQIVDLSIRLQYELGRDVVAAGQDVDVYDANMIPIETATSDTTTGVCSFQSDYWEGETVYLQVYVAPNTAAGITYLSPLLPHVVPEGDVNGDSQLPQLIINEVMATTTAPTFTSMTNEGTWANGTAALFHIHETHTYLTLTVHSGLADSVYGLPAAVHDQRTGYDYLAGAYLRIVTDYAVDFVGWDYHWADATSYYYVWGIGTLKDDGDIPDDDTWVFMAATGSTFDCGRGVNENVSVVIDFFDCVRLNSAGNLWSGGFYDFDTTNSVTAITTRIVGA